MRRVLGLAILMMATLLLAERLAAQQYRPANLYEAASCEEVARAGWPWCHWKWARHQDPCDYAGYYVGGGAPGHRSREHCSDEGTWGWDFQGHKFERFVRLGWTNPPRRQGGQGSYQPDGPRIMETIHEAHDAKHARR